jgi:hypothetical protein
MIHPTHCLHVFLVSKPLGRCFSPGLTTRAEIEQGRKTKINRPPAPPKPPPPPVCMLSLPVGCMKSLFPKLFVTIFCSGSISLDEKWSPTVLERKISCNPHGPWFFLFECLGGEGFLVFSPYSQCVPIKFPKGSLWCSQWHLDFMDIGLPTIQLPCIQTEI